MVSARRAVFFDRDGVLNEVVWRDGEAGSPRDLREVHIVPGARELLEQLRSAGFLLMVVTNQPDIARGFIPRAAADEIARAVRQALPIDDDALCPHDDADNCECRKPRPGMIWQLAARWSVDAAASYMVGDRWRDIEAGRAAGCRTVLIRKPYNGGVGADLVVENLGQAVAAVLSEDISSRSVRPCA